VRGERSPGGLWILRLIVAMLIFGVLALGYWVVASHNSLSDRSGFICVIGLSLCASVLAILAIGLTLVRHLDLRELRDDTDKISGQLNSNNVESPVFSKKNKVQIPAEVHRHREQIMWLNGQVELLRGDVDRCIRWEQARYLENQSAREARQRVDPVTRGSGPITEVASGGQRSTEKSSGAGVPLPLPRASDLSVDNREAEALQDPATSAPAIPNPPKVYFASVPEEDGSFKDLKEREEYDALYKLTLDGSPAQATSATVDLCPHSDGVKAAIQLPNRYLSPVCVYDANPLAGDSGIIQEHPGRAERSGPGQRWKIKDNEKLRIRFW